MNERYREWLSFWKMIVAYILFFAAIRVFLFAPVEVDGASMLPTIENGDRVIVSKQSTIERFDVIVFRANDTDNYIKRVVGLPGDRLTYERDKLVINGNVYEEPYLDEVKRSIPLDTYLTEDFTLETYTGHHIIPEGYVFVLGDNRQKSTDSRDPSLGLVTMDVILGEAEVIVYPFENFGVIK